MVRKMKRNKDNTGCLIVVALIALTVGLICWVTLSSLPIDKDKAEKYFNRDKKDFYIIAEYFANSDYPSIRITESNGKMFVGYNKTIADDAVVKAVHRLLNKRGYRAINKNGNTISFLRWIKIIDFVSGIAYSINEEDKPKLQFLTLLEPLSESGWYYYEEDYNEWRTRNR